MKLHARRTAWMCWVIAISLMTSASGQTTQPTGAGKQVPGTVKGTNVYVRSGSDQNYYPVTKLNKGDAVTIVGERFNWLEILPPQGTFSVVDKNYVDKVNDSSGTLNGETWAYAGSQTDERRYAKQVRLKKGDKVEILGETSDGKCFKIACPPGATLWISGDFVDRTGAVPRSPTTRPTGERVPPGEALRTTRTTTRPSPALGPMAEAVSMTEERLAATGLEPLPASALTVKNERYQAVITAIESKIDAERAKPEDLRNFEPLLKELEPLAAQTDDEIAKVYADTRIKQIRSHVEIVQASKEMAKLRTDAISQADRLHAEAMRVRAEGVAAKEWIDVRGEIIMSGLYDGTRGQPKRWRVVEPGAGVRRTLAYIEVPAGSPINPEDYYGKYVGIKAETRTMLTDTKPPVAVYTVKEIRVLEPPAQGKAPAGVESQPSGPVSRDIK